MPSIFNQPPVPQVIVPRIPTSMLPLLLDNNHETIGMHHKPYTLHNYAYIMPCIRWDHCDVHHQNPGITYA